VACKKTRRPDESAPIHKGDAVPVRFNETHSFSNNGTGDSELLIIGISAHKNVLYTEQVNPPENVKTIKKLLGN
jgi:mannose-6-phosphate isomerase-like protein (cupin superfamily)